MLSFNERKLVRDLELKHGVIISASGDGLVARHWKTDDVIVEADDLRELEIVLRSMHVYAHEDSTL